MTETDRHATRRSAPPGPDAASWALFAWFVLCTGAILGTMAVSGGAW